MLDDRKKRILQAIVDEYVNTAEPVSSGAISKKKGLDFSSATIRNEMSELEKSGYLEKTHTSSGRIPSVKGYRLYVDELLKEDNISLEEIKYIKEKGRRVGISVKPETDVKEILEFLPYVHVALVMTVEPGKGGQELISSTIEKIIELNFYREEHKLDYEIEADGGIKVENSEKIIDAGADILVAGTAIINSKDYAETIKKLR